MNKLVDDPRLVPDHDDPFWTEHPHVTACYVQSLIPEYRGNPFIEALPPEISLERLRSSLPETPSYDESERKLPSHLRGHCLQRVFDYFEPVGRHFDVPLRIDLLMRMGYRKRNPKTPDFRRGLQEIYERGQRGELVDSSARTLPASMSMSIIGVSGTGKTRSLRRSLANYPQVIWHPELQMFQIVWMHIECPHDGSVKQLCLAFFEAVDALIGTHYADRFGGSGVSAERRLLEVAQIARLHAVGLIVFDELQHVRPAGKAGIEKIFNFFVTLVNTSEAPIVLVGTMAAQDLLQVNFRQGRRAVGLGGLVWERFERDGEWEYMMESIWRYQWTRKVSPLTAEIAEILYVETQGIIDLAVKLYVLAQYRAMVTGVEEISAELIKAVANDEFKIIRPMLDALASGDPLLIAKFDDLRPLEYEKLLAREQLKLMQRVDVKELKKQLAREHEAKRAQLIAQFVSKGMPEAMAELAASVFFSETSEETAQQAAAEIEAKIGSGRKTTRKSGTKGTKKALDVDSLDDDDLRKVFGGSNECAAGYDSLHAAGVILPDEAEFLA